MIKMTIEADIAEYIDPLYASEQIAKHIRLRLSMIDWIQQMRFEYGYG